MDLKGSKTEQCLRDAFSGESEARNKYSYFASVAKKEGYEQIAGIFDETAGNEKEHAKMWFKLLNGIGDTNFNLQRAAEGEHYEATSMYPEFAKTAREEGFESIARKFELVAQVEAEHEKRYNKLFDNLKEGKVFEKDTEFVWICRNCGHLHTGKNAPKVCPTCDHPQAFFEIHNVNY